MVRTEDIMNTLFKAKESEIELFAETLVEATTLDSQMVDGSQLDKIFSFGMVLTRCDICRENHWFVGFAEHGHSLQTSVPEGEMIELVPATSFESAVETFKDLNNDEPKH